MKALGIIGILILLALIYVDMWGAVQLATMGIRLLASSY